jgi:hypothetical protein
VSADLKFRASGNIVATMFITDPIEIFHSAFSNARDGSSIRLRFCCVEA